MEDGPRVLQEGTDAYPFPDVCECTFDEEFGVCEKCSIVLALDVANDNDVDGDAVPVTSLHLKIVFPEAAKDRFEVGHFVDQAEQVRAAQRGEVVGWGLTVRMGWGAGARRLLQLDADIVCVRSSSLESNVARTLPCARAAPTAPSYTTGPMRRRRRDRH